MSGYGYDKIGQDPTGLAASPNKPIWSPKPYITLPPPPDHTHWVNYSIGGNIMERNKQWNGRKHPSTTTTTLPAVFSLSSSCWLPPSSSLFVHSHPIIQKRPISCGLLLFVHFCTPWNRWHHCNAQSLNIHDPFLCSWGFNWLFWRNLSVHSFHGGITWTVPPQKVLATA